MRAAARALLRRGQPPAPAAARRQLSSSRQCAAAKRQRGGVGDASVDGAAGGSAAIATGSSAGGSKALARSVRPMPIKVVCVSKANSPGGSAFAAEWLDKLRRYSSAEVVTLKPNPLRAQSVEVAKAAEGAKVVAAIGPRDRVVLLDERGADASSEDFARLIAAAGDDGVPLTFCIGGPFGHGPAAVSRADKSIRLSRAVLNHSVALVVLLEQLYRGWTILHGEPYHH